MDFQVIASGSTGNCYLVDDGETKLLIEAGVPIATIQKSCGYHLADCSGCLVSHCHGDHAAHVGALLKKGVDIYASGGTIAACKWVGHRVHPISAQVLFSCGSWICLPFDTDHDAPEPLGFLLQSTVTQEKLLYFTDTPKLRFRFTNVSVIAAECNYDRDTLMQAVESGTTPIEAVARICKSHMGLGSLLQMLGSNDFSSLQRIYLIHLSNRHADEKLIKRAVQEAAGVEVIIC